ncbi:M28 family peptidase [Solitalea koreensis]|uniref:Zn-dependent amino-or carboxypeptidase, M28 family n=1 Tax=Solitalea koreensis TaxID=543615 RepID=A0A521C5P5_9SPHI|nr:M28 family metallopeptidase [Solitalea koreensis]SMO54742.1 Zn-dependent amino-or carboxypeptidase, M28 family [Solitalea koreensis]
MKRIVLSLVMISCSISIVFAQTVIINRDPRIENLVKALSVDNLRFNVNQLVSFGTRHTLSDTISNQRGIGAARRWIFSEMSKYSIESGGRLKVEYDSFMLEPDGKRVPKTVELKNVVATLPGVDPKDNRVFVVSGHFDSRASDVNNSTITAPGANDDASGTATVMELARVMSKERFSATVIFACVAGEEQGLYGSTHLAKIASDKKWNVQGMITNDIVGNSYGNETDLKDNQKLRVFSEGVPVVETAALATQRQSVGGENDSPARQFARYIKEIGERYVENLEVKLIYRRDRYLRGGDHIPFSNAGFTAVRITEMNENFDRQHQDIRAENGRAYGDLPEFVDYNYLQKVTAVNLATLANLAMAPQEPKNVGILTKQLTNATTLTWEAPEGIKPKGYYMLVRETTSPFWEKKIFVAGSLTQFTLPVSKDNYFFAVQSVDEAGHESLPIFPKPIK